jgi:hypothetical protein
MYYNNTNSLSKSFSSNIINNKIYYLNDILNIIVPEQISIGIYYLLQTIVIIGTLFDVQISIYFSNFENLIDIFYYQQSISLNENSYLKFPFQIKYGDGESLHIATFMNLFCITIFSTISFIFFNKNIKIKYLTNILSRLYFFSFSYFTNHTIKALGVIIQNNSANHVITYLLIFLVIMNFIFLIIMLYYYDISIQSISKYTINDEIFFEKTECDEIQYNINNIAFGHEEKYNYNQIYFCFF